MAGRDYQTDVALLSVTTTEFHGVMHFHSWKAKTFAGDDQIYDVSSFERDGRTCSLVHAKIDEMGMTAAATSAFFRARHRRSYRKRSCLI